MVDASPAHTCAKDSFSVWYGSGSFCMRSLTACLPASGARAAVRDVHILSYESVRELAAEKHSTHLSDSVLDEYAQEAE